MRINNKRINVYIEAFYTLLFIGLIFSVLLIFIPIPTVTRIIEPVYLVVLFLVSIFLFYKIGHQHVEYSSDGEILNIKTQDTFWAKYFPKSRTIVDFPKNKLSSFNVRSNLFQKQLELYVRSKRSQSGLIKLTFNITYLSKNEVSDLKRSLTKIVNRNKENKPNQLEEVKQE